MCERKRRGGLHSGLGAVTPRNLAFLESPRPPWRSSSTQPAPTDRPRRDSGGMELGECTLNPGFRNVDGGGSSAGDPAGDPAEEPRRDAEYAQIKPYAGMPKEVLLLHSSKARYRVPREILFWLLVTCTLALVALTVTVIALSPRCMHWWQVSPVYQVYLRSFKDSDGDGVGDLKGIQEQLNHFQYLNIESVWVSPFYRSPMRDSGYDVEDFRAIDPLFGTMQDFEKLLAEMHNRGLKLIVDFIPNHTSDRHRWFNLSRAGDPRYKDFYVWTDCNGSAPRPNNWVSVFGNSAWTYDDVRGQCYLHQFLKEQPELNFRNPHVRKEMTDIIHFWLEKGVDGFRMGAVNRLLEATHLRDEPQVDPKKAPESVASVWDLHHDYTTSQLGLHDLLRDWRDEMQAYGREPGRYRFMVTESYDYHEVGKTMMYYGSSLVKESDFPFNFYLLDLPQNTSGLWVEHLVRLWMANMPKGQWPNWLVGNHDQPRVASSAGRAYIRAINMLLLTLPGTPTTYYGEEIGMEDNNGTDGPTRDPAGRYVSPSRDPQRSPMQWSGDMNAGFNVKTNTTWLPLHPDYRSINVKVQDSPTLKKHLAGGCSSFYFPPVGPEGRRMVGSGSVPLPEHAASVRAALPPWLVLLRARRRQCLLIPPRAGWAQQSVPHGAELWGRIGRHGSLLGPGVTGPAGGADEHKPNQRRQNAAEVPDPDRGGRGSADPVHHQHSVQSQPPRAVLRLREGLLFECLRFTV
ncbi:amino acid transporter heavy chain SLC3A1 isoform 1-T1 [Spinachia spinachia]